jgi:hypothetical protein
MAIRNYILWGVLCFATCELVAQSNDFNAGIYTAVKFCQIDGDQESGFNKVGYAVGLEIWRPLKKDLDWMTGVMLAERGSRSYNDPDAPNPFPFHYRIRQVEVPLYIKARTKLEGLRLLAGVRAGYLFAANDRLGAYSALRSDLRTASWIGGFGAEYQTGPAILRLEFQYGLNSMRKPVSSPFFLRSGVYHNNVVLSATFPLRNKK